jgi:DNA invertase Pin-like site-specific DNA recombinase
MSVHAYIRPCPSDPEKSAAVQRQAIESYCRDRFLHERPSDGAPLWYVDPETSGRLPLHSRPAGGPLCRNLRRGDHVVVHSLNRIVGCLRAFVLLLQDFDCRGVNLHACDVGRRPTDFSHWQPRVLAALLDPFAELERVAAAELAGQSSRQRRANGEGLGRPALGFRYVARYRRTASGRMERRLRQVPDEYERSVMKIILRWRREDPPRSYDWIRQMLNYRLKLPTRVGGEWSLARVRRAAEAEAILQEREARIERIRCELRKELAGPTSPGPDPSTTKR